MRSFDLDGLTSMWGGEYVLAAKDLHSDACYMIYGKLEAQETDRLVQPGSGYEEILCAVDGPISIRTGSEEIVLERGHSVHVKEDESFCISNPLNRALVYIIAGGRTQCCP
jgi:hypothetical protein